MNTHVVWHYPRTDTAQSILDLFDSGATHAITIFALRRMGKTELLLDDVGPLAKKQGFDVRYASFWEDIHNPQAVLLRAITHSTKDFTSIKARLGLGNTFIEAQREPPAPNKENLIEDITRQFQKMAKGRKRVLLMLDEVQQLARVPDNEAFIAAFRTLLDTHKKKVAVIFTGSSREGLLAMFKRQKAPLFNFSHQYDLPELGSEFVAHMLAAFHQASSKKIALAPAVRVFHDMRKVPARFHDLLRSMLINGRTDIEKAYQEYKTSSQETLQFEQIWQSLKPLDRQVLILLTDQDNQVYSEQARIDMAYHLGLDSLSKSAVQRCISRLKQRQLIESFQRGQFEFTDLTLLDLVSSKATNL